MTPSSDGGAGGPTVGIAGAGGGGGGGAVNVVSLLRETVLVRPPNFTDSVAVERVLGHGLVGIYFSASWCPPCRQFTTLLSEAWHQIRQTYGDQSFEVVLVPRDNTSSAAETYATGMPWLMVPFGNESGFVLKRMFTVTHLPRLVVIDKDGHVISENARGGQFFGFGCDPLNAFRSLLAAAGQPAPKPRIAFKTVASMTARATTDGAHGTAAEAIQKEDEVADGTSPRPP
eukprot:TRINITY_DN63352_c0_g1_i1.p1 TRINITY_DN63352_c0_g1~~TRINITY_DN63352_c0_g1_i1.p1  ORF type:complete len:230 (-),score=38.92 TRINITY_DN63352_c0_g1_i1:34-723(-)